MRMNRMRIRMRRMQKHTPCAIDKIPDFSVLGQAILMVDRLFLGQENILKSGHWNLWCGDFQFVLVAKFGSSLEVKILRFLGQSFLFNNFLSIARGV